jgi:TctA family transporter
MLLGLYGFGFMFAAVVMVMREANTLTDVGNFLVQIFSGANFPVTVLPRWLLPIALALPLTYGFDAVRGILLNTNTLLPIMLEYVVMLVFMVAMIGLVLGVIVGVLPGLGGANGVAILIPLTVAMPFLGACAILLLHRRPNPREAASLTTASSSQPFLMPLRTSIARAGGGKVIAKP